MKTGIISGAGRISVAPGSPGAEITGYGRLLSLLAASVSFGLVPDRSCLCRYEIYTLGGVCEVDCRRFSRGGIACSRGREQARRASRRPTRTLHRHDDWTVAFCTVFTTRTALLYSVSIGAGLDPGSVITLPVTVRPLIGQSRSIPQPSAELT